MDAMTQNVLLLIGWKRFVYRRNCVIEINLSLKEAAHVYRQINQSSLLEVLSVPFAPCTSVFTVYM